MASADRGPDFGVYVHWPFCLAKCPYCDFNSHVRHAAIDEARFARAFAGEIAATAARVPGRTVSTIFFGGGTPSLMQPATVATILDAVARHWTVAPDVEVTLEANPTSVEATRFRGFRAAGVNRVSLGVQALDDAALKQLGRQHSADEALAAVAVARANFERYSFDLIYARPGQTPDAWAAELKRALAHAGRTRTSGARSTIPPRRCARTPACPPTRSPTTRGRVPNAGTISCTGARRNMPASDRARTGGLISDPSAAPPRPRSGRRPG